MASVYIKQAQDDENVEEEMVSIADLGTAKRRFFPVDCHWKENMRREGESLISKGHYFDLKSAVSAYMPILVGLVMLLVLAGSGV